MNREEREQVGARLDHRLCRAGAVCLAGADILGVFGITLPAFRVAGGFLLFFIAFEMVFDAARTARKRSRTRRHQGPDPHIAAFPLAIPLIAGPARSLRPSCFGSSRGGRQRFRWSASSSSAAADVPGVRARRALDRFLGQTGRSILTRLLGVILAALAVQFVADGIKALHRRAFWAYFAERMPALFARTERGNEHSRWLTVGHMPLIAALYLTNRSVGLFVRGPRRTRIGHVREFLFPYREVLAK